MSGIRLKIYKDGDREIGLETIAIIWAREMVSQSRPGAVEGQVLGILRRQLTGSADRLGVGFERKRCVKDELKSFGLNN